MLTSRSSLFQPFVQRGPPEQLHGHVGHAALLAEVVDRDDVGVVELGRGPCLALEALAAIVSVDGPGRVGMRICPDNPFNDLSDDNPQETFEHLLGGRPVADLMFQNAPLPA